MNAKLYSQGPYAQVFANIADLATHAMDTAEFAELVRLIFSHDGENRTHREVCQEKSWFPAVQKTLFEKSDNLSAAMVAGLYCLACRRGIHIDS